MTVEHNICPGIAPKPNFNKVIPSMSEKCHHLMYIVLCNKVILSMSEKCHHPMYIVLCNKVIPSMSEKCHHPMYIVLCNKLIPSMSEKCQRPVEPHPVMMLKTLILRLVTSCRRSSDICPTLVPDPNCAQMMGDSHFNTALQLPIQHIPLYTYLCTLGMPISSYLLIALCHSIWTFLI